MTTFPDLSDFQRAAVLDQPSFEDPFAPDVQFGEWLQAVESFRNRQETTVLPGAYVENNGVKFEDVLTFYDDVEDKISCSGTLVVTEHGQLQADVEVTMAMIDGVFKGNIKATRGVVLDNHALVIGDIYTPELTVRGGAIIEGTVRFDERPKPSLERPRGKPSRSAFRESLQGKFAKVWRSRIFSW